MAIVDMAYYTTVYMGQEATDCDFPALEARAEDIIGAMTHWVVTDDTIANLTPFQTTLVKKAICAQVDFLAVNGLDSIAGSTGQGFTVGKVSVSGKAGGELAHKSTMAEYIAPMAKVYLEQSGLMNPAVDVAPAEPFLGVWPVC